MQELADAFRPEVHWGAEFLAEEVRLCAFARCAGVWEPAETFRGTYGEAEDFARKRGLAWEGLHGAVSHLPFKLVTTDPGGLAGGDWARAAEPHRPAGMGAESLEVHGFSAEGTDLLLLAREASISAFNGALPPPLASLWSLVPSPMALMRHRLRESGPGGNPGCWAALMVEAGHTHILLFRRDRVVRYAKVFAGRESARSHPADFLAALQPVLGGRRGTFDSEGPPNAIRVWSDGDEREERAVLSGLGLPVLDPGLDRTIAAVPAVFRVAAACAFSAASRQETIPDSAPGQEELSFSVPPAPPAESRRRWRRRSSRLARIGMPVVLVLAAIAFLLAGAARSLEALADRKAEAWAPELRAWDRFQEKRAGVEASWKDMGALLVRRTRSYASFQTIAARLPDETWVHEWDFSSGDPGGGAGAGPVHRITGYSLAESQVSAFLARLEGGRRFKSIKLKSTERIDGDEVARRTGLPANRRALVRFQLVVTE